MIGPQPTCRASCALEKVLAAPGSTRLSSVIRCQGLMLTPTPPVLLLSPASPVSGAAVAPGPVSVSMSVPCASPARLATAAAAADSAAWLLPTASPLTLYSATCSCQVTWGCRRYAAWSSGAPARAALMLSLAALRLAVLHLSRHKAHDGRYRGRPRVRQERVSRPGSWQHVSGVTTGSSWHGSNDAVDQHRHQLDGGTQMGAAQ